MFFVTSVAAEDSEALDALADKILLNMTVKGLIPDCSILLSVQTGILHARRVTGLS